MSPKLWNVYCNGKGIGQVTEDNEELARCAALSKFGDEGERATREALQMYVPVGAIYDDDEFSVHRA